MVLTLVGCCLEFAEPVVVYSCWDHIFLVIFFLEIVSMAIMIIVENSTTILEKQI